MRRQCVYGERVGGEERKAAQITVNLRLMSLSPPFTLRLSQATPRPCKATDYALKRPKDLKHGSCRYDADTQESTRDIKFEKTEGNECEETGENWDTTMRCEYTPYEYREFWDR